jgi:hypothetical protein
MVGSPAQPRRAFFREVAVLRRLARANRNGSKDKADKGTDTD